MKQLKQQHRQGDVWLVEIDRFPDGTKRHAEPMRTIAVGEVQGHSHRLEGGSVATCELPGGRFGVEVLETTRLEHGTPGVVTPDAHKTQMITPGKYVRILQHEWDPNFDSVPVQD